MKRKIVRIDETKCNGCGQCVTACVEGAIKLVNGKARLVSDSYCDGLGACLGECPQGAITIEEREAAAFDEEAAKRHAQMAEQGGQAPFPNDRKSRSTVLTAPSLSKGSQSPSHVCPGTMAREMKRQPTATAHGPTVGQESELSHWPVQLKLVAPNAPFLQNAQLLLAADCVPVALADFHARFLRGRVVVVGCPKLDDPEYYVEKLTAILKQSTIESLTIVHMEVPCCFGLNRIAQAALAASGKKIPVREVTVGIDGTIKSEQ
jgi:Pyruvate/2-oxoacid:ferredoxin oxidoreductase delta subunit